MESEIARVYGGRVRLRVCGLCWSDDKLLLANHALDHASFWSPPGGGLEFGETLEQTLIREFREETNLAITPGRFLFGCEYIDPPLHAVELFFEVTADHSDLKQGSDPELPIISGVSFMSWPEIMKIPHENLHGIFRRCEKAADLMLLKGFYTL